VFPVVLVLTAAFLALYSFGTYKAYQSIDPNGVESIGNGGLVDTRVLFSATLFGLSIFAVLFLGTVLAIFLTHAVVRGDAERGLLQPLVVRPVGRAALLAGRFGAAALVCAVYVVIVTLIRGRRSIMKSITRTSVVVIAAMFAFAVVARGADEDKAKKVKPSEVPAKVLETIKKHFPDAKTESIEKEVEDGKTIYDFEMKLGKVKWEADVAEDGTLIETEQQIEEKDAPPAVMGAVKQKFPHGNIKEVMAKTKGEEKTVHEYEVVVRDEAKDHELTISPDGKIKEEGAGDEAKDKDDKDKEEKPK